MYAVPQAPHDRIIEFSTAITGSRYLAPPVTELGAALAG